MTRGGGGGEEGAGTAISGSGERVRSVIVAPRTAGDPRRASVEAVIRATWGAYAGLVAVAASATVATGAACSFGVDVPALSECIDRECDPSPLDGAVTLDAQAQADAAPDGPGIDSALVCPEGRGPRMVRITAEPVFCIDESEVTNDQYLAFVSSKAVPDPSRLATTCRSRTDFTPKGAWPPQPGRGTSPVAFVDFCDAQAFCVWSGKTLCGAREGGPLDVALMNRAPFDPWFVACGGDQTVYPYGNVYGAKTCNGQEQGVGVSTPVMSLGSCRSGVNGPFDMSGNLWEWTDTCERDVDLVTDRCFARGGAFNAPSGELECKSRRASTRGETDPTIGFRCCAR